MAALPGPGSACAAPAPLGPVYSGGGCAVPLGLLPRGTRW